MIPFTIISIMQLWNPSISLYSCLMNNNMELSDPWGAQNVHHPFIDRIFHEINSTQLLLGYLHLWKPPFMEPPYDFPCISIYENIWQCVKTLYPCSSHQNSWDLWMFIPLKMVCIGIDPYPFMKTPTCFLRKAEAAFIYTAEVCAHGPATARPRSSRTSRPALFWTVRWT